MPAALRTVRRLGRDPELVRAVASYALFSVTEYSVWIAVLVYAYGQGGATTAGLVAFAELVPAALVAPFVSAAADRRSPARVLAFGYAVQALAVAAIAVTFFTDAPPLVVYAAAVVASTAVSSTRPSLAALVPALSREPEGLTAANAALGWVESVAIAIAGLAVGATLTVGSVGHVCAWSAALLISAAALVAPLHVVALGTGDVDASVIADVRGGIAEIRANREARGLVVLLGAEFVVFGALDVLEVVLVVTVLDASASWVGYFTMAFGVGGIVLGAFAALLVGRRLGPVITAAAIVLGVALSLCVTVRSPYGAALLLLIAGGCRLSYDVATRTLLQRTVPADMVARIFGLAESAEMAGLAIGSLLAPTLVAIGGGRFAIVGIALILPLVIVALGRVIADLDGRARVPVVEIALLRSVPLFRDLPAPSIEGVARALRRIDVESGAVIIRQGDPGEDYYAIADGVVDVSVDGRPRRTMSRGEGVGEIALLEQRPRTATVVARTPVTLYALDRAAFLTTVSAHMPTQRRADGIVRGLTTTPG